MKPTQWLYLVCATSLVIALAQAGACGYGAYSAWHYFNTFRLERRALAPMFTLFTALAAYFAAVHVSILLLIRKLHQEERPNR
jgi:branched-subunit amino acid ABC-type transport system permease component